MRRSSTSRRTWRSVTPRCSASFGMSRRCGSRVASDCRCLQLRSSTTRIRAPSTRERDGFLEGSHRVRDHRRQRQRHDHQRAQTCRGPQADLGGGLRSRQAAAGSSRHGGSRAEAAGRRPRKRSQHVGAPEVGVVGERVVDRAVRNELPEHGGERCACVGDAGPAAVGRRSPLRVLGPCSQRDDGEQSPSPLTDARDPVQRVRS